MVVDPIDRADLDQGRQDQPDPAIRAAEASRSSADSADHRSGQERTRQEGAERPSGAPGLWAALRGRPQGAQLTLQGSAGGVLEDHARSRVPGRHQETQSADQPDLGPGRAEADQRNLRPAEGFAGLCRQGRKLAQGNPGDHGRDPGRDLFWARSPRSSGAGAAFRGKARARAASCASPAARPRSSSPARKPSASCSRSACSAPSPSRAPRPRSRSTASNRNIPGPDAVPGPEQHP